MSWRLLKAACLLVVLCGAGQARAGGLDPRNEKHEFLYRLYPPSGFSVKKSKAVLRADAKQPKAFPLIDDKGRFTELAQWYYDIGSDPKSFETWWYGYFKDENNWTPCKTPVFEGTGAGNQGHRIIAWLGTFNGIIQKATEISPEVKESLCNEEWKRAAEKVVISTIDEQGMLEYGGDKADMACVFHFLRTKWGALGLRIDHIYSLERAQNLMCSLLTLPWVICEEDKWLDPPNRDYLEEIGRQNLGKESDIRIVRDGKVLFTGGLFIGWKDKPSLHGTWDGLSIINTLFKYYPDPDPESPKSIFCKWNKLPEEQQRIGRKMILLCSRRLWLDWAENKGRTWCWVRDGKPTDDDSKPSEAPFLPAYDGYGDNQLGWAKQAWEEMFGEPTRNTNDGVQALLAIAQGKVHRNLKTPLGQQVAGRHTYDKDTQTKALDEDLKRLGTSPEEKKALLERAKAWGYAGEPATVADETPKLDPRKERPGKDDK